ncbi:MAG: hypothetical protein ABI165_11245, partial [Bryobacteraceae bacterium]
MNSLLRASSVETCVCAVEDAMNGTNSKKLSIGIIPDCGWPPGDLVTVIKINATGIIAANV